MKPSDSINQLYAKMCQDLGDKVFQQYQINHQIKEILKNIKKLNDVQPDIVKILGNGAKNEHRPDVSTPGIGVPNNQSNIDRTTEGDESPSSI